MSNSASLPWYQRAVRWGQTNITELDSIQYDIDWWRDFWRRTCIQGVIVNAGGIVAYYPSKYSLQYRAQYLGDRDLYGELSDAAKEDGLYVLARMDSNRTTEEFYSAHPEWFAIDSNGDPYRAGNRYVTCIFSDYYESFLPGILEEVIERYQPQGFTDNSWSGLSRTQICHCDNCARSFKDSCGYDLPTKVDWDSDAYRAWIRWNYDRRLEVWDLNNRTTQAAGGEDCLWLGMTSGNIFHESIRFRDDRGIYARSKIVMLDHQRRDQTGFQQNGDTAKRIHGQLGWDKLIPESMSQYDSGRPVFRLGAKHEPEARMWMVEGIAGGIQPWWHFIGAYHEDRRGYRTAPPVMQWHEANEEYLVNRSPIATVGLVWSQENVDFYGRDNGNELVMLPYNGMMQAMIRDRIPYLPVHADDIARDAEGLDTLILPNLAAMSEAQIKSVRDFVVNGGNLVATGESSLYTEWGDKRDDFALAELFGVHITGEKLGATEIAGASWETFSNHTYLRLVPELRGQMDGPQMGMEPPINGERHPVFKGFEETDIVGFAGHLELVRADPDASVLLTYVPPFPIYPPEFSWMREPVTDHAGLVVRQTPAGGRVAYLPADIDRCFARYNLPDHGDLLANTIRWACHDRIPISVTGGGLIDCHFYSQPGRVIAHLVNLTSTWEYPVHELVPTGPYRVALRLPESLSPSKVKFLVGGSTADAVFEDGWVRFEISSIADHEVVVVE